MGETEALPMALDTIGLESPPIEESVASRLEQFCKRRLAYEVKTGDILFELTTGELAGSYDHRIMFRVERSRLQPRPSGPPVRVDCAPYLAVEGSVHKALLGHNVYGGPECLQASAAWLVDTLCREFEVSIDSPVSEWTLRRVDWAEIFEMPSFEACSEFFRGLNASDYPRRQVNRYGLSGLYAPGHTTATKFYHKGVEFAKHDRSRLGKLVKLRVMPATELDYLQVLSNKLIRVEVEIKARKLRYDHGELPRLQQVSKAYLLDCFDRETFRILREADKMETVREARTVQQRLLQVYGNNLGGRLFGVWMQLATLGEQAYKASVPKPTFYRQRKQLVESGCDWHATDVILREHSLIPEGFSLRRGSQWHLQGEHPKLAEKLLPFRQAA